MQKLSKLDPAEVSLVPKGANRKKFLIWKSDDEGVQMNLSEMLQKITKADPKDLAKIEAIVKEKMKKAKKKDDDEEDEDDEDEEDIEKAKMAKAKKDDADPRVEACMKAIARIAAPFKDKLKKADIMSALDEAGIAGDEANDPEDDGSPMEGKVKDAHMKAAKSAAMKSYKSHLEKMGYKKYPDAEMSMKEMKTKEKTEKQKDPKEKADGDKEDNVSKAAIVKEDGSLDLSAIPEDIRPTVEAIYKGQTELVKKNVELEKQLKDERTQRITKEFDEKAKGYKNLGADTAKLSKIMKSLSETDADALKEVEAILKAADEQVAKGNLFGEFGSSQSSAATKDSWEKIEKAAEGYVAKSDGKINSAEGVARFLETKEGKTMYAEYIKEKGGV